MITTSTTSPYREKKERRSVSVMLEGRPPRNTYCWHRVEDSARVVRALVVTVLTLGKFCMLDFLGFCMLLGLHAFGSTVLPSRVCGQEANTALMLSGLEYVTKPKPRQRPVSCMKAYFCAMPISIKSVPSNSDV